MRLLFADLNCRDAAPVGAKRAPPLEAGLRVAKTFASFQATRGVLRPAYTAGLRSLAAAKHMPRLGVLVEGGVSATYGLVWGRAGQPFVTTTHLLWQTDERRAAQSGAD